MRVEVKWCVSPRGNYWCKVFHNKELGLDFDGKVLFLKGLRSKVLI